MKITVIATGLRPRRGDAAGDGVAAVTPVDLHSYTACQATEKIAASAGGGGGTRLSVSRRPVLEMPAASAVGGGGRPGRWKRSAPAPNSSRCLRWTCRRSCGARTSKVRARHRAIRPWTKPRFVRPGSACGPRRPGGRLDKSTARASAVSAALFADGRHLIHMARSKAREADGAARDVLDVLQREVGYIRKPHGGRLRVALAFPNTYFVGMSNLGFQTVYRLFNELDDVVCERVFLPGRQELAGAAARRGKPLRTVESGTPGPRLRRLRLLRLVRVGLHQRRLDAAAGRRAGARRRRGHGTIRSS